MKSEFLISLLLFSCAFALNLPFRDENISKVLYSYTKTNGGKCNAIDTPDIIRMVTSYLSLNDKKQSRLVNRMWYTFTEYTLDDITRILKNASENGHLKVVKMVLADGRVDPSSNNNWAVKGASENGHSEIVELLLADERVNLLVSNYK